MPDDPDTQSILIMAETASISTRRVASGRVTISTRTEEIDRILPAELASVEVSVVQVPVDRKINSVPEVVAEGDLTIIPVVEERLVATRELYLREEIHVRRVHATETVDVPPVIVATPADDDLARLALRRVARACRSRPIRPGCGRAGHRL